MRPDMKEVTAIRERVEFLWNFPPSEIRLYHQGMLADFYAALGMARMLIRDDLEGFIREGLWTTATERVERSQEYLDRAEALLPQVQSMIAVGIPESWRRRYLS